MCKGAKEWDAGGELVDEVDIVCWRAWGDEVEGEVELAGVREDDVQLALDGAGEWWDNVVDAESSCRRTVVALAPFKIREPYRRGFPRSSVLRRGGKCRCRRCGPAFAGQEQHPQSTSRHPLRKKRLNKHVSRVACDDAPMPRSG